MYSPLGLPASEVHKGWGAQGAHLPVTRPQRFLYILPHPKSPFVNEKGWHHKIETWHPGHPTGMTQA